MSSMLNKLTFKNITNRKAFLHTFLMETDITLASVYAVKNMGYLFQSESGNLFRSLTIMKKFTEHSKRLSLFCSKYDITKRPG